MYVNPLLLIAVIAFVVMVIYVVWTLLQLRKTLLRIDSMVVNTERELVPLLANLRESSESLRLSANHLQRGAIRAEDLLVAIGEVGDSIRSANNFLRSGTSRYMTQGMALWSGFQMFRSYLKRSGTTKGE